MRRLQTGLLHHKEESSLKTLRQDVLLRVCQQAGLFDVKNYMFYSILQYCIADLRLIKFHDPQVVSGPNSRVFLVFNVSHTLLSHHSAPYFSLEAPAMPE